MTSSQETSRDPYTCERFVQYRRHYADNRYARSAECFELLNEFSAGSFALEGTRLGYEATVISNLRASGAVLLGKTNLSQWANFRGGPTPNGWSSRGGQGYGVYHDRQDPAGSSSGSAVAARLGLAAGCLGTEVCS